MVQDPFKPARRVAGQKQDVWSIVNEAAQASPIQPIVNMGQGFFGYNPPQFVLDAAHQALGKVECNQYSPTKVRATEEDEKYIWERFGLIAPSRVAQG